MIDAQDLMLCQELSEPQKLAAARVISPSSSPSSLFLSKSDDGFVLFPYLHMWPVELSKMV